MSCHGYCCGLLRSITCLSGLVFPFLIGKLRIILCQQLNWEQKLLLKRVCGLIPNFWTLLFLNSQKSWCCVLAYMCKGGAVWTDSGQIIFVAHSRLSDATYVYLVIFAPFSLLFSPFSSILPGRGCLKEKYLLQWSFSFSFSQYWVYS